MTRSTVDPRKERVLFGLLVFGVGAAAGWVLREWTSPPPVESEEESSGEVPPQDMTVGVVTGVARSGDLPITVSAAGVVRAAPGAATTLSTRAGGRIVGTSVKPGDLVRKGDPILRFDSAPLEAALAQARAFAAAAANQ